MAKPMACIPSVLSFAVLFLPGGEGDTLIVTPTPGTPPGAFITIQAAIDAAVDGDTIALLDGTFTGPGNRDLDLDGKAITLRSQNDDPESCILDAEWLARGLTMDSGEGPLSVLRGITFRRCSTLIRFGPPGEGAGIKVVLGSPTIDNCVFEQARSGKGGAIYLDRSSPTITSCRFNGNAVSMLCLLGDNPVPCGVGAGICCENSSSPLIYGCSFEDNDAQAGGGAIACMRNSNPFVSSCVFGSNTSQNGGAMNNSHYSHPKILDCVFRDNHAVHTGGAIVQSNFHDDMTAQEIAGCVFQNNTAGVGFGGALSIGRAYFVGTSFELPVTRLDRCTFTRNSGTDGGALFGSNVALRLTSCAFVENSATGQGGALYLSNLNPPNAFVLVNCTLLRNSAASGAAVHGAQLADLRVRNTILWDSTPAHVLNAGSSISTLDSCFVSGGWPGAGTNNSSDDPLFVDIENGDIHLGVGSPCADTGTPEFVPPDALFDIDHQLRVMAKRVDVGADERLGRPIRENEEEEKE